MGRLGHLRGMMSEWELGKNLMGRLENLGGIGGLVEGFVNIGADQLVDRHLRNKGVQG